MDIVANRFSSHFTLASNKILLRDERHLVGKKCKTPSDFLVCAELHLLADFSPWLNELFLEGRKNSPIIGQSCAFGFPILEKEHLDSRTAHFQ
jgi:hypothetical protein